MLKPRAEVVAFIQAQLIGSNETDKKKNGRHHYGFVELRDLLDFIYGEPKDGELLVNTDKYRKY